MKIFVVNLPEAVERRASIEKQLHTFGFHYEIFSAVNGRKLTDEEKNSCYIDTACRWNLGRSLGAGELGCALSHYSIYRKMVENSIDHALILEDDAWLNPNLSELLQALTKRYEPRCPAVVLLTWTGATENRFERLWSGYVLKRINKATCTHGYFVTNQAAKNMSKYLYPIRNVADCWGWMVRERIVELWAVSPPCLTQDLSHVSHIAGELPGQVDSEVPLIRTLFRIFRLMRKTYLELKARLVKRPLA